MPHPYPVETMTVNDLIKHLSELSPEYRELPVVIGEVAVSSTMYPLTSDCIQHEVKDIWSAAAPFISIVK